jgi:CheY-like chemotaxis protein
MPMSDFESKFILLVEDDDMNYIYIKQLFKILKIEFDRVKTGTAAIECCHLKKYDAVMMDIQLPGINGYEATRAIREFDTTTPIIAQTASKSPGEADEAILAGCNDILVKPFKIDDLKRVFNKIF